ncbi:MAG: nucleotidyltransferase family protein [Alphaproteobacteria bacterium]|nr:nucleotidyltransferase family protein [Alphaproteobacteria bacterium]
MAVKPDRAMVLAAGFGLRMRPLTEKMPKPLVPVAGRALLDHVLDRLAAVGVTEAVVNVHYLPEQIIAHVAPRISPRVVISREDGEVLGTGGGVVKALPLLGDAPFFHVNSDTLWIDAGRPNLARMADRFDPAAMDVLLLMAPVAGSLGYSGRGDYSMAEDGRLCARGSRQEVPLVYAGAAILSPAILASAPQGGFALTGIFARVEQEGRLYGIPLEGLWMHVGSPDAIAPAEAALAGRRERH